MSHYYSTQGLVGGTPDGQDRPRVPSFGKRAYRRRQRQTGGRAHLKKHIVLGVGAAVAVATCAVLLGAGVADAAPNVVGLPYHDAAAVINDAGGSAVVVNRVGSTLEENDCLVTNAWDGMFVRATSSGAFKHAKDQVMLALNCSGSVAKAGKPGNSAGREANASQQETGAATATR